MIDNNKQWFLLILAAAWLFIALALTTLVQHHTAECLLRHPGCARTRTRNAHRAADHDAPSTLPLLLPSQRGGLRAPKAEAANQKRPDEQPKTNTPMRAMTGIASWDSHLGRGFLLCPHYPPAFWHARRPISRPNDVDTDLPVPNAIRWPVLLRRAQPVSGPADGGGLP